MVSNPSFAALRQQKISMKVDISAIEQEHRQLTLISEIHIYVERRPNGQRLKAIRFMLPLIEEDTEISLDNNAQNKTMVLR